MCYHKGVKAPFLTMNGLIFCLLGLFACEQKSTSLVKDAPARQESAGQADNVSLENQTSPAEANGHQSSAEVQNSNHASASSTEFQEPALPDLQSNSQTQSEEIEATEKANQQSSPQSILYIGDSLSVKEGGFSNDIRSHLTGQGHTVDLYALAGSSPGTWLSSSKSARTMSYGYKSQKSNESKASIKPFKSAATAPHLPSLLKERQDVDTLVVQLGTNLLTSSSTPSKESLKTQIRNTLKAANTGRERRVVWIGPPNARKTGGYKIDAGRLNTFYEALDEVSREVNAQENSKARLDVVDSRVDASGKPNLYPSSGGDGVHFYTPAALEVEKKWIQSTKQQLAKYNL